MLDRARPFIASLAFLGLAATLGRHVNGAHPWPGALFVALPALAALGAHSRALAAHVGARAVGWLYLVASALLASLLAWPDAAAVSAFGAVAVVALGRDTYEARAAAVGFDPIAHRGAFLAAITTATAVAIVFALVAIMQLESAEYGPLAGTLVFGLGLIGAAIGVLRMRALGVFLGVGTALFSGISAALSAKYGPELSGPFVGFIWSLPVVAGLAFAVPIAWSRVRPVLPASAPARRSRIAPSSALALALAALAVVAALAGEPPSFG